MMVERTRIGGRDSMSGTSYMMVVIFILILLWVLMNVGPLIFF
jgi:hypothetical protein